MATIHTKDGIIEIDNNDQRIQAYNALKIAAERIGKANYEAGLYKRYRIGRKVYGYSLTQAHKDIIKAMPKVLDGSMSPNEAMCLIHRGDVTEQRLKG